MWRSRGAALVALALVAAGGWFLYTQRQQQQRATVHAEQEATLRAQLKQMRGAIARFRSETARYPETLEELAPKYLQAVPVDPFTGDARSWQLIREDVVAPNSDFSTGESATRSYVIDVRSGAGRPYSDF